MPGGKMVRKIKSFWWDHESEEPKMGPIVLTLVVAVIFVIVFFGRMLVVIGPGETGVVFDPLGGGVQETELREGFHIIMPWVTVDAYNVKIQDYTMSIVVGEGAVEADDRIVCVTREGLYLDLDMTVWYRINISDASYLRQNIGMDGEYQNIIVRPTIRSAIREVVSNHDAIDVYGEDRELVAAEMLEAIEQDLAPQRIMTVDVLLRHVELPLQLTEAIEQKKRAEQDALAMVYILEKENMEKIRKIIEAEGIFGANEIISQSLSDEYLVWYWISNLDTHESVIYVPVGEYGLPIFRQVETGREA